MLLLLVILLLILALASGLAAKLLTVRPEDTDEKEGATVQNVLAATGLITALVVAFVISGASSSYSAARTAAKAEADVVDNLYEAAEYVAMPFRQNIQAAAVCYARAVAGPEWDAMAGGDRSPVPSNWTGTQPYGIRRALIAMGPSASGFSLVQSADAKRGELRNERVAQASPTVPGPYFWFMVALLALSLGGLAYSIPRAENRPQLVALGVVVMVFVAVVFLVYNFDRPFSNLLALKPTPITSAAQDIAQDYEDAYQSPLPCNELGEPTAEASAGPAPPVTTTAPAAPTTTRATGRTTTTLRTTTTSR